MERAAIFHRPVDNLAYVLEEKTLHIRLKTKANDLREVLLIHGDPYIWENGEWTFNMEKMYLAGSDGIHDYWEIKIFSETNRVRYGFQLISNDEEIVYTEKGFYSDPPKDSDYYFCFPYLHNNDIFDAPEWVKDTVWYQIFPERFANGDPSIDPPTAKPWGSEPPAINNFFGGDFAGVIQHLDYLSELGVNGIYFTPVFKASSNHKYDTIDYLEIDPQFGDKESLKRLVKECHERGIKVMLDAVFNHSGYYFPPFQDVLENGESSRYKDWFHIHNFPVRGGERPNYEAFGFVESMPKLNTANPEVKKYLMDVGAYWIEEYDIDGWRLDVANEVDHHFWREFRSVIKGMKPDVYILGEIWHDSMPWLRGDQFDAVMNYPFKTNLFNLVVKETIPSKQFVENMTRVYYNYPKNVFDYTFNLVGSHDTARLLTECDNDTAKVKQIFTLLLTFMGTPCIYYGDEIGLTGDQDPGCRKCMEWDESKHNIDLKNHVKELIHLRKNEKLLANDGSVRFIHPSTDNGIFGYEKFNDKESIFVLFNPAKAEQSIEFNHTNEQELLYSEKTYGNGKILSLGENGYAIIKTSISLG